MKNRIAFLLFSLGAAAGLQAAPKLRLTQTAIGPVLLAQGSNLQIAAPQLPYAYNAGDGSLNLKLTSSDSWLVATLGSTTSCQGSSSCTPVQISLQTASLAKGTYTGFITVSDPNSWDAPQTVSVTVAIGGGVPDQITLYAAPNGTATSTFNTTRSAGASASTKSDGSWLSVAAYGNGSFGFSIPYTVIAKATDLSAGDYNGTVAITGSSLAVENKSVPVVLHVTAQPIAQPSSPSVRFQIAQGAVKQSFPIAIANSGQGTLTVSGADVTTTSGTWLTAAVDQNVVTLTADPTGVSPGTYQGTVTVNSNAANGPNKIPVQLVVEATGPPVVSYGGVVNNGTFSLDDKLSQGDITAVFGDQFTAAAPTLASSLPLATTLGDIQVLINNQPVPLYYASVNQINFLIPYDAPTGDTTLTVVRGGQKGNTVGIHIDPVAPALLLINGGPYAIMVTPQNALTGIPSAPAHPGDVIVLYAIGLGPTNPVVVSGAASPSGPPASLNPAPQICFGAPNPLAPSSNCVDPFFAGLTPGLVGLYQLNFTVPSTVPTGNDVQLFVRSGNALSNVISVAIQ